MKQLKGIDGKLDKAWSELVKLKAGNQCEYCKCKSCRLNSHHIYSRANRSVRWSVRNGICLCVQHHTFDSKFSAHLAPVEFTEWLYEYKGDREMTTLRVKAKSISKISQFEKEIILTDLKNQIKKWKNQSKTEM